MGKQKEKGGKLHKNVGNTEKFQFSYLQQREFEVQYFNNYSLLKVGLACHAISGHRETGILLWGLQLRGPLFCFR